MTVNGGQAAGQGADDPRPAAASVVEAARPRLADRLRIEREQIAARRLPFDQWLRESARLRDAREGQR